MSDLGLEGNRDRRVRRPTTQETSKDQVKPGNVHPPGLFDAGLLRDGRDDFFLSVRFVLDWLFLFALVLLQDVPPLQLHSFWALPFRGSLPIGTFSFALWAFLVCALTPLPPFLLGWGRHRVLLSHLLGNQLGVDPGFPVDDIQRTNID